MKCNSFMCFYLLMVIISIKRLKTNTLKRFKLAMLTTKGHIKDQEEDRVKYKKNCNHNYTKWPHRTKENRGNI